MRSRFDIDVVLGAANRHDGSRGTLADRLSVVLVDGACRFLGDFSQCDDDPPIGMERKSATRGFAAMLGCVFTRDLLLFFLGLSLFLAAFAFPTREVATINFDDAFQLILTGCDHDRFAELVQQRE